MNLCMRQSWSVTALISSPLHSNREKTVSFDITPFSTCLGVVSGACAGCVGLHVSCCSSHKLMHYREHKPACMHATFVTSKLAGRCTCISHQQWQLQLNASTSQGEQGKRCVGLGPCTNDERSILFWHHQSGHGTRPNAWETTPTTRVQV